MSELVLSFTSGTAALKKAFKAASPPPLNTLRELALRLGSGAYRSPSPDELEKSREYLRSWLISGGSSPTLLPASVLKAIPFLLWECFHGQFAARYDSLLQAMGDAVLVSRSSWVARLALAYMEAPLEAVENGSAAKLGALLHQFCEQDVAGRLAQWASRNQTWGTFAPERFVEAAGVELADNRNIPLEQQFEQFGFSSSVTQTAGLAQRCFEKCLLRCTAARNGYDAQHLARVNQWADLFTPEGAGDLFTRVAWHIINGLLEPWELFNPPSISLQNEIRISLEKRFGAPGEKWRGQWREASALSRVIIERWKVLDVMMAFFAEVEKYASRRNEETMLAQWPYRRAFWLAYYRRGVVSKARALVGTGLRNELGDQVVRQLFGAAYARFEYNTPHHCGLLLEINGLTVIDLSHNGRCHFFFPQNEQKPDSRASIFGLKDLAAANAKEAHHGSERYHWQLAFRNLIERHAGVSISHSDYSLSTLEQSR